MLKLRYIPVCVFAVSLSAASAVNAAAQSTTYRVTPLASSGTNASHQSSNLLNPWGIAFLPGQGFSIAENVSGRVDTYDANGNSLGGVMIPAPSGSTAAFSKPTGIAADPEAIFGQPGANFQYLVAADNGTIWGFRVVSGTPQPAQLFADLGVAAGGIYTGIAVLHPDCCAPYVAVANFAQGEIITYGGLNTLVSLSRNQFSDPNLPAGYSPFNLQQIGNQVFVTYALKNSGNLPVPAPGAGLIDIYDLEGNFLSRFVSPGGVLSAPWGIALAGPEFGPFGTAIVVGNAGDGMINAFGGGNYLGTLNDTTGSPLHFVGLHGLAVRSDGGGDPNAMYEVGGAELGQPPDGTFAAITPSLETMTSLSVPSAAVAGTAVTLTAHTSSASGTPAGIVTFFDGTNRIGQQGLDSSGAAPITISSFGVGNHSIAAEYVGNFDHSISTAASLTITASTTTTRYHFTPILSDLPGLPNGPDTALKNPWGLTFVPAGPFWTVDNGSSNLSVFDQTGAAQVPGLVRMANSGGSASTPTGIAFNPNAGAPGGYFVLPGHIPGQILFSTQDGIIGGWGSPNGNLPTMAIIARDDSASGAAYDGMAIVDPIVTAPYLALADFHRAGVQIYTPGFDLLSLPGNFVDPALPAGYAPFNIQQVGSQLFVTYALQDAARQNPVAGAGNGIVDVFDLIGNFVSRFASNGVLNEPWGIVQASANFGDYSNDVLIANHGDGAVNAFDPATGNYLGTLTDEDSQPLNVFGIWALAFRSDNGTVDPNALFFTDGENQGAGGLFGSITVANQTASTPSMVALSFTGDITPAGVITMIANVSAASGTPTGAVSFFDGLTPLGSAPVIDGKASLIATVFFEAGVHSITARYSGDATFLLSRTTASLTIPGFADTVSLSAPATAVAGTLVTLAAQVSAHQATPSGSVSFNDGTNTLGTAALDQTGKASLAITTLSVGVHQIVASYGGDVLFQPNTSQPATITITSPPPPPPPMPTIASLAPFSIKAATSGSTLTINGTGFVSSSVVTLNTTALNTTFVSPTQLTAVVPAGAIMNSGTVDIQVANPAPGGSSSNEIFPIDTATNTSAAFTQSTQNISAGQSATVNAQLTGFTGTIASECLNAPAGVTCSFDQSSGVLTIQSTANTPKRPFALTVVFTGTTPASTSRQSHIVSASLLTLPALLFGLVFLHRRRRVSVRLWVAPFALLAAAAISATGCGGGRMTNMPPANPPAATQPAQTSAGLIVTVQ